MSQNPLSQGILTKQDIENKIDSGSLILHASKNQLQACSYDLRIGKIFRDGKKVDSVTVEPGEIISLLTEEELDMPNNIMATVFAINGKSSEGLLVLNPGHIDPGFKGHLTVQALNLRKTRLAIEKEESIFTIIFQHLSNSTTSPYSKNVSKAEKERNFNNSVVEKIPKHIGELMSGKNSPLVTTHNFQKLLMSHWMSYIPMFFSIIGLIIAVAAIVIAIPNQNNTINNPSHSSENLNKLAPQFLGLRKK
jgi:deoxycytidine triphosphate deaminase